MTGDFFWAPRPRPTRGPKPALTLGQIADAAIAVADAEGLAAVSMQRVAADLGYTKMSLYRYLPGKAELVAAMIERAPATRRRSAASGGRPSLSGPARCCGPMRGMPGRSRRAPAAARSGRARWPGWNGRSRCCRRG